MEIVKKNESKKQTLEMKYLYRLKGVTMRDHIRNEGIGEELGIKSVPQFIQERQPS